VRAYRTTLPNGWLIATGGLPLHLKRQDYYTWRFWNEA
jgi:hypothetical protein